MIKKTIRARVDLRLDLNEKEFCNFVGCFSSCTGNTTIDREKAERFLRSQMSIQSQEECKEFNILEFQNGYKRLEYKIDLVLQGAYEFSKDERGFRDDVYRFITYALSCRDHQTIIRQIEFSDNTSDVNLNERYYMVLNSNMTARYNEDYLREFKLDEQRIDRLFYEPTGEDEDGNRFKLETPKQFYEHYEGMSEMCGFPVCNAIGLTYYLSRIENSKIKIFECMCGGDVVNITPNLKRFETVTITKELTTEDIKNEIEELNLPYNLNDILFYDSTNIEETDISEDIIDSLKKFDESIKMDTFDARDIIKEKLEEYFNDPFVAEEIINIYRGYKDDGMYQVINDFIKPRFRGVCYDHSIPEYISLSCLISNFSCIDFSDICNEDFKLGSDLAKKGVFLFYDRNDTLFYNNNNKKINKLAV